tara:strand:- start:8598 stop:9005 length:408 start_codon:yes stop_codon:yes gene_type:complete
MNIKKAIYIIIGSIFFAIGLFGYYMPVVPGTIFIIISAYFFMHSSDRLYNKIVNNSLYGKPIKQYLENNVIPFKTQVIILLSMWGPILITLYLTPSMRFPLEIQLFNIDININLKILVIMLSAIGTIVVLRAKNK